jgi:hypothetical protein
VQQGGVALFAWRKDNAVIDICHPRIAKIAKKSAISRQQPHHFCNFG